MFTQWLGINGFRFFHNDKIVLLDPWVTRNNDKVCNKDKVAKYIPEADYIFIGHSHWDHLADAAEIYRQTGAVIVGSKTTMNICRCQGVPESNLKLFEAGDKLEFEDFNVEIYASVHKQPMVYPGEYKTVPETICGKEDFLEGGTFALLFDFAKIRILNIGSANFLREKLRDVKCDYLLAGIAGRSKTYLNDLINLVFPEVIIPTHFDYFDTPLEDNKICIDIDEFKEEVYSLFPELKIKIPVPLSDIRLQNFNHN